MKKTILLCLFLSAISSLQAQKTSIPAFVQKEAPLQVDTKDKQAPVVNCTNVTSVNILPSGVADFFASDFLQSVSDNETPPNQIRLSIRECGTGAGFVYNPDGTPATEIAFNCDQLGTHCVELWAMDASGNANYCETYVTLQDNIGVCPHDPADEALVSICVTDGNSNGVEEAQYLITGINPNGPFYAYEVAMPNLPCVQYRVPKGSDVTVSVLKDDNPLNGVTSFDVVLIDKHINGIEQLNTPYKVIAADANHDGLVTKEDSNELRNLILGIYTDFPNNTSWRFVDKSYVFPDPGNPFLEPLPESVTFHNVQSAVSADFVAIKVGDVNNSAVANALIPDERAEISSTFIGNPSPNPGLGPVSIPVALKEAGSLRLEVLDISGKMLWYARLQMNAGTQVLEIPASVIPSEGMYLWRVETKDRVKSGKIIRG